MIETKELKAFLDADLGHLDSLELDRWSTRMGERIHHEPDGPAQKVSASKVLRELYGHFSPQDVVNVLTGPSVADTHLRDVAIAIATLADATASFDLDTTKGVVTKLITLGYPGSVIKVVARALTLEKGLSLIFEAALDTELPAGWAIPTEADAYGSQELAFDHWRTLGELRNDLWSSEPGNILDHWRTLGELRTDWSSSAVMDILDQLLNGEPKAIYIALAVGHVLLRRYMVRMLHAQLVQHPFALEPADLAKMESVLDDQRFYTGVPDGLTVDIISKVYEGLHMPIIPEALLVSLVSGTSAIEHRLAWVLWSTLQSHHEFSMPVWRTQQRTATLLEHPIFRGWLNAGVSADTLVPLWALVTGRVDNASTTYKAVVEAVNEALRTDLVRPIGRAQYDRMQAILDLGVEELTKHGTGPDVGRYTIPYTSRSGSLAGRLLMERVATILSSEVTK